MESSRAVAVLLRLSTAVQFQIDVDASQLKPRGINVPVAAGTRGPAVVSTVLLQQPI